MAEPIPPGGKFPSRQELNSLLGSFLGDTNSLSVDRRTVTGRQMSRIYSGNLSNGDLAQGLSPADKFYAPQSYDVSQTASQDTIDAAQGSAPAFIQWDIPTSSTNYSRPRTVAAGYDGERQTMTVVFRDGTFYNYYEVTKSEWDAFYASYSKGAPWLNRKNNKQAIDGLFINKPRGNAGDMGDIDPAIRQSLYQVARTQQMVKPPKKGRTQQTLYKTGRGKNAYYGIEDSPRGRKRQQTAITNRVGRNPATANKAPRRKAS